MLQRATSLLIGLILIGCAAGPAHAGWSISRIAETFAPAVVRVTTLDERGRSLASGTGFFISREGTVATVHHLLERASRVLVETREGEQGEILEIVGLDARRDLLIGKTTFRETPTVMLGDSSLIRSGEDILLIAHPTRGPEQFSTGTLVDRGRPEGPHFFRVTAPILPGWSGAPVFDASGRVIGIAAAFLNEGEHLNFVVPVHYLSGMEKVSIRLGELPERPGRVEAALRGKTLIELLVTENPPPQEPVRLSREPTKPADPHSGLESLEAGGGSVHFKSGKVLRVARAWREGETLFVVIPGKAFAVGYPLAEILRVESLHRPLP